MKFQMYVDVVIRDKNGKILQRIRKRKCSSYVRAMMDVLRALMGGPASTSAVDTGGTTRTITQASGLAPFGVNAGLGVVTHGIRVGTGTNAVTISDYALQTAIAEGTGSGQLSHSVVTVGAPTTVGSSRQFTIARTFTNNSGASITVNEVGLIAIAYDSTAGTTYYFLVERSLLTFSIANGSSATVTYTIKVTV